MRVIKPSTLLRLAPFVLTPALASPLSLPWLRSLKARYISDTSITGSGSAGVMVDSKYQAHASGELTYRDIDLRDASVSASGSADVSVYVPSTIGSTQSEAHEHGEIIYDRRGHLVDALATYSISANGTSDIVLRDLHVDSLLEPRDLDSGILSLNQYYDDARLHSNNLESYSAEAKHGAPQDGFRDESVYELRQYNTALYSFQALFSHLGRDKGLAYYDRQNDLETLLKNVINLHKYTLKYLAWMVADIPTLGPIVAPILYDTKCTLDLVLNSVENLSDATINSDIQPLLRSVIGSTTDSTCKYGGKVLGLCL